MDASDSFRRQPDPSVGANRRLARIAELTGVPVEAFFGEPDDSLPPSLPDLIRLWEAIDDSGRARVLDFARAAAAVSRAELR